MIAFRMGSMLLAVGSGASYTIVMSKFSEPSLPPTRWNISMSSSSLLIRWWALLATWSNASNRNGSCGSADFSQVTCLPRFVSTRLSNSSGTGLGVDNSLIESFAKLKAESLLFFSFLSGVVYSSFYICFSKLSDVGSDKRFWRDCMRPLLPTLLLRTGGSLHALSTYSPFAWIKACSYLRITLMTSSSGMSL